MSSSFSFFFLVVNPSSLYLEPFIRPHYTSLQSIFFRGTQRARNEALKTQNDGLDVGACSCQSSSTFEDSNARDQLILWNRSSRCVEKDLAIERARNGGEGRGGSELGSRSSLCLLISKSSADQAAVDIAYLAFNSPSRSKLTLSSLPVPLLQPPPSSSFSAPPPQPTSSRLPTLPYVCSSKSHPLRLRISGLSWNQLKVSRRRFQRRRRLEEGSP